MKKHHPEQGSNEIYLARGQTAEPSDDYHQKIIAQYKANGLCEHGYGFVEYCPSCKDHKFDNEQLMTKQENQ